MPQVDPDEEEVHAALDSLYGEMRGVEQNTHKPPKRKRKPVDHKSKGKPGRRSPVTDYVRSLGKDYRTTHEVAEMLEVSENFVRKLARDRVTQAPSYVAPFGKTIVNLYTPEDVQALKDHIKERHKVIPRAQYDREQADEAG